jgi:putative transposase
LLAEEVIKDECVSVGRACRIVGLNRSMFYYKSLKDDSQVERKLQDLAEKKPTRGFGHYFGLIRNEGLIWNHKRVERVYKKLGLNLRRKRKRRVPARVKEPLVNTLRMNQTWSMDFMHDALEAGRKVKVLNIIDDFNREALAIDVAYSIPGEGVKRALEEVIEWRGKPDEIRTDNGPEFISAVLEQFCESNNIRLKHIQPGKPVQNAFIERFNRTFREDVLDAYIFKNVNELIEIKEEWMKDYNENYPHQSLGGISPKQYLKMNKSYSQTV